MGAKYNSSYNTLRNRTINAWNRKCIFNSSNVDMAGLKFTKKNKISAHHIYDKKNNYIGLGIIGRKLHDYIDNYLINFNKEEYYNWNSYLHKVYRSVVSHREIEDSDELIKECDMLLLRILSNNDPKAKKYVDTLKPYIEERHIYILDLIKTDISMYDSYLPNKILNNKNFEEEYLNITEDISRNAYSKYLNITVSEKINELSNLEISTYKKSLTNIKFASSMNNITTNNLSKKTRDKYVISAKGEEKTDWMGNNIYPAEISESSFFLSRASGEIIGYLKRYNRQLYISWMKIFQSYKNSSDYTRLKKRSSKLRLKTLNTIYSSDLCSPENKELRIKIRNKIRNLSKDEAFLLYHDSDEIHQIVIEYVRIKNDEMAVKEQSRKDEFLAILNKNNNFTLKINNANEFINLNNDEMGNSYNINNLEDDQSHDGLHFLSSDSRKTLELLKSNRELYAEWKQYLTYVDLVRKDKQTTSKEREDTLVEIYTKLLYLREKTKIYFKKIANYPHRKKYKEKCNYFANLYESKDIKFYVNESLNHVDSKKLDSMVTKIKIDDEPVCDINQYIDDINARNIFGRKSDTSVNLRKSKKMNKEIASKCNTDWMGLHMGYTTPDENHNSSDLLNVDAFLYERSIDILLCLKDKNTELYNKWIEYLVKRSLSNDNEQYNEVIFNLLKETSSELRKNKSNLEGLGKETIFRVRRAYTALKKYGNTK